MKCSNGCAWKASVRAGMSHVLVQSPLCAHAEVCAWLPKLPSSVFVREPVNHARPWICIVLVHTFKTVQSPVIAVAVQMELIQTYIMGKTRVWINVEGCFPPALLKRYVWHTMFNDKIRHKWCTACLSDTPDQHFEKKKLKHTSLFLRCV